MSDYPPSPLEAAAARNVCRETINGWIWYCDAHDTHGNADTQEEADYISEAHEDYHTEHTSEECAIFIFRRTSNERLPRDPLGDILGI